MSFLILIAIFFVISRIGLAKIFEKAGEESWKAYVPYLSGMTWCKILGRPSSKYFWLLVPVINIFTYTSMIIETEVSFGYRGFWDHFKAVVLHPYRFYQLGYSKDERYKGQGYIIEKEQPIEKPQSRQWAEAIFFAVFAASFIRMFLIEAYKIPTSSMEGALKVGDQLFVSKVHYGMRTPETPLSFPLLHNRLPFVNTESYLKFPNMKSVRFPAITDIERNDPVVFNVPDGDSVLLNGNRNLYYHLKYYPEQYQLDKNSVAKIFEQDAFTRPVDKRDNYVKRCVAIPGDKLEIKNGDLYINDKLSETSPLSQRRYKLTTNGQLPVQKFIDLGVFVEYSKISNGYLGRNQEGNYTIALSKKDYELVKKFPEVKSIVLDANANANTFPHADDKANYSKWSTNNYGPITLPAEGMTVKIDASNYDIYRRAIQVYEENNVVFKNGQLYIDGEATNEYTFKMDYYWMMGDNRDNSEDSRFFGYVPHDHIVGKPLFIWFSKGQNGIRWNRFFKSANIF